MEVFFFEITILQIRRGDRGGKEYGGELIQMCQLVGKGDQGVQKFNL